MSEQDLPNIMTRVASVEQSYFPPSRPTSMFQRTSSSAGPGESQRSSRPRRPSLLRRAITASPTATVTVSTDRVPPVYDTSLPSPLTRTPTTSEFASTPSILLSTPTESVYSLLEASESSCSDDDSEADLPLTTLDLSSSNFSCIPTTLFLESECFFQITTLDLSFNPLCSSQDLYLTSSLNLPCLTKLSLQRCGISRLSPLITYLKAPQLRELDISGHGFTGFVPEFRQWFPALVVLDARMGQFEFVEESAVNRLRRLDLRDNFLGIREGDVKGMGVKMGVEILV